MGKLFSGPSHVDIQGERVLRFEEINQGFAQYSLIGYENGKQVKIIDYRDFGLKAMQSLLETGVLEDFAPKFNHPANTTIVKTGDGLRIELRDTDVENPPYMLWISIGIDEEIIPDYEFLIREMQPYSDNVALLSLYKRPYPDEYPLYYSPVNP